MSDTVSWQLRNVNRKENMGTYKCSSENGMLNSEEIRIEIKDRIPANAKYCQEIITKTYKGTYKWNRTLTNTKISQKCVINELKYATYECANDTKWSNLDIKPCHFESNLTQYLDRLLETGTNGNETLIFTDIVNKLLKSKHESISVYDLTILIRLLNNLFDINTINSTNNDKFIWFIDYILTQFDYKLLNEAQLIDNSLMLLNSLVNNYLAIDKPIYNLSSFLLFKPNYNLTSTQLCVQKSKYTRKLVIDEQPFVISNASDYELCVLFSMNTNAVTSTTPINVVYYQNDYLTVPSVNASSFHSQIISFNSSLLSSLLVNDSVQFRFKLHSIKELNKSLDELESQLNGLNLNLFDRLFSSSQIASINKRIFDKKQLIEPLNYELKYKYTSVNWFNIDYLLNCTFSTFNLSDYYYLNANCMPLVNSSAIGNVNKSSFISFKLSFVNRTNLNLDGIDIGSGSRGFKQLINDIVQQYRLFSTKIVYFSSIFSLILLLLTSTLYIIKGNRVLMPRSFRHILINIWLCISIQLAIYVIGYLQVNLTLLCIASAFLLHIFILSTYFWYNLYYYHLFIKLNRLKANNKRLKEPQPNMNNDTRNVEKCVSSMTKFKCKLPQRHQMAKEKQQRVVVVNHYDNDDNCFDDDDMMSELDSGGDEYVEKPVIQLYMYAYGVSTFICSIGFALSKRYYIYGSSSSVVSSCFMNHYQTIFSTLLLPIIFTLLFNFIFIILIIITLKQIMKDINEAEAVEEVDGGRRSADVLGGGSDGDGNENERSIINYAQSAAGGLSQCTSVMDTQYRPQVQLIVSVIGLILYTLVLVFVYLQQPSLVIVSTVVVVSNLSQYSFYIYSLFTIIYSIKSFAFYLLTREDVINCNNDGNGQSLLQTIVFKQEQKETIERARGGDE